LFADALFINLVILLPVELVFFFIFLLILFGLGKALGFVSFVVAELFLFHLLGRQKIFLSLDPLPKSLQGHHTAYGQMAQLKMREQLPDLQLLMLHPLLLVGQNRLCNLQRHWALRSHWSSGRDRGRLLTWRQRGTAHRAGLSGCGGADAEEAVLTEAVAAGGAT
jgi:hypothetical protein